MHAADGYFVRSITPDASSLNDAIRRMTVKRSVKKPKELGCWAPLVTKNTLSFDATMSDVLQCEMHITILQCLCLFVADAL